MIEIIQNTDATTLAMVGFYAAAVLAMFCSAAEMKRAAIVAATLAGLLGACAAVDSAFPAETTVEKLDRLIQVGEFADCETDGEITARAASLGLDLDELHAAGVMPF